MEPLLCVLRSPSVLEADPAASTTTDASGAFRFESLPNGAYDMVVTAAGHADGSVIGVMPTLSDQAPESVVARPSRPT